jgi:3-oxoacyl-[acyl-carrier protein] reductase
VVTGGGSGIGRASAFRLAADGTDVAILDVRYEAAEEVAQKIRAQGGQAQAVQVDVTDESSVEQGIDASVDYLGGLDAVITSAGISLQDVEDRFALEPWTRTIAVNLGGTFTTLRHSVPKLIEFGGGSIVTIGSVAGLVAAGTSLSYAASKGGVIQLTKLVAAEYADKGIRINCVCPGTVETGLAANSRALTSTDGPAAWVEPRLNVPMPRRCSPEEIAAAVVFLTSDAASFITGVAFPVDGGYTAI